MSKQGILVAIPVFNEIDVYTIIRKVRKFPLDILVIDDGSTNDLCEQLIDINGIHVITHKRNLGYGKTIIDAFRFAIQHGYEYLLTIDGDGQHEPEEISLFLNEIPSYDYDILSGSRYFPNTRVNQGVPPDRYRINKEITGILNRITGYNLTDAFCGFKAYKVKQLKLLHLTEHGYGMPLQFWIQAWRIGLRVKEIPVTLIYKDLTKRFKGILEDPETRLCYYKNIIEKALACTRQVSIQEQAIKKKISFNSIR
ncbi:MAG: glycosyltransferase family 2 protein [Candidatus Loosdrechtia sp.]|uniref:glycosyltransferase family 2 protein n=1 Tax=Candidatus Loosdrechtia sp. TaxID=3101272 RepID=UPI003A741CE0|nr:MAG: glycosyltransferase family 2 protein [Candidatus Jettenia sp. AMX2]